MRILLILTVFLFACAKPEAERDMGALQPNEPQKKHENKDPDKKDPLGKKDQARISELEGNLKKASLEYQNKKNEAKNVDHHHGLHERYRLSLKEDNLYSRLSPADVKFYANLCDLVYLKKWQPVDEIIDAIQLELIKPSFDGYGLLTYALRNFDGSRPTLSTIYLYKAENHHIIVIYKGSVHKNDWQNNFTFFRYSGLDPVGALNGPDGKRLNVHSGFASAYLDGLDSASAKFERALGDIFDMPENLERPLRITIIGHSLGGALAMIAGNDMPRILANTGRITKPEQVKYEVLTFAAARVFDEASAKLVEEALGGKRNVVRFTDGRDIVNNLPAESLGAKHLGLSIDVNPGKGQSPLIPDPRTHSMANYIENSPRAFAIIKKEAQSLLDKKLEISKIKKELNDSSGNDFDSEENVLQGTDALNQKLAEKWFYTRLISRVDGSTKEEMKAKAAQVEKEISALKRSLALP